MTNNQNVTTYGPLKLPKSGKEIFFREPTLGDKMEVLKANPITEENLASGNEVVGTYIALKCITTINGVQPTDSYKFFAANWPKADVDFFKAVFGKVCTSSTEEDVDVAVDFLLGRSASGTSSTATTPQTEQ
ncbi:hypothetical protein JJB07_14885 [Tumebacillus sp. ITR2]|uniref:Phage tail protein n=1 Tax=Tumebacillus amylolyticus TaxID=2801339 RepID=A0ABS1JCB8_9BACL|nr:hypothetical protein [Tumebacillus amylolyticus]MBL0387924.1 hypothetical protein [Tumebacillus amylolyticus]